MARRAESIERALATLEATEACDQEALSRLEASLSAAATEVRRLAEQAAPEHASFTERRADADWSMIAAQPATALGPPDDETKFFPADEASADLSEF